MLSMTHFLSLTCVVCAAQLYVPAGCSYLLSCVSYVLIAPVADGYLLLVDKACVSYLSSV